MSRILEDFLSGYLEYCKNTEPPTQYHLWCGIGAIAAALQRKVYINWGPQQIFPNMYIVLIGDSGRCRKGVAFDIVQDLIRGVGIKNTAESITREKLIKDFATSVSNFTDPDKGVKLHCSLTAFVEELSIFLGQNDVKFLADLTDWYNAKNEWTYSTKGQGTDKIQGICFNLIGGTAPDWLSSILPGEAVGGGFTARIIFVVEEDKKHKQPRNIPPDPELRSALIKDLEKIHLIMGEMKFAPDALAMYEDWYINKSDVTGVKDPKFGSYNERRATHLRKLAMVCSASRGSSRRITKFDLLRATKILEATEIKMPRVFRSLGKARYGELTAQVFDFIKQEGKTTASKILRRFSMDIDQYTLQIVTQTLAGMKVIRAVPNTQTLDTEYSWIKEE